MFYFHSGVCNFSIQSQIMLLPCSNTSVASLCPQNKIQSFLPTSCIKWPWLPRSSILFCYLPCHLIFSWNIPRSFPPQDLSLRLELSSTCPAFGQVILQTLKYHQLGKAFPDPPFLGGFPHYQPLSFSIIALRVSFIVPSIICHHVFIVYLLVKRFTYLLIVDSQEQETSLA